MAGEVPSKGQYEVQRSMILLLARMEVLPIIMPLNFRGQDGRGSRPAIALRWHSLKRD